MKKPIVKYTLFSSIFALIVFCLQQEALAFGSGFNRKHYSFENYSNNECTKTGLSPFDCFLLDPPGTPGILEIGFELRYDSSKIEILPELSGFVCDFSSNGSCPSTSGDLGEVILGDPREGTSFDLLITNDTVLFSQNLSGNPTPPIVGETFFFGLAYRNLIPSTRLVAEEEEGVGDIFQVESGNFCVTVDQRNDCGSENPTFGFSLQKVPEPTSTLSLLAIGTLGAALALKHKQN